MLTYRKGDMFTSSADAIVVAVNCVGVLGAGQAKEFAQHYPMEAATYRHDCKAWPVKPGDVWALSDRAYAAATKDHWSNPSKAEWVIDCIKNIHELLTDPSTFLIKTIAVPRLGCGLGGLDWKYMEPHFQDYFESDSDWTVEVWSK